MNFTKTSKEDLTQELVAKVLRYDATTGNLTWLTNLHSKRAIPNSRAGSLVSTTGYRNITLFGRTYLEHHLIWFICKGVWPKAQLDHINQIRDDNRITNLREVTVSENARNRSRRKNTTTGEHGIWYNRRTRKYVAEITLNGKKVYQKSFDDPDEASAERKLKSLELGFHENHGSQTI